MTRQQRISLFEGRQSELFKVPGKAIIMTHGIIAGYDVSVTSTSVIKKKSTSTKVVIYVGQQHRVGHCRVYVEDSPMSAHSLHNTAVLDAVEYVVDSKLHGHWQKPMTEVIKREAERRARFKDLDIGEPFTVNMVPYVKRSLTTADSAPGHRAFAANKWFRFGPNELVTVR